MGLRDTNDLRNTPRESDGRYENFYTPEFSRRFERLQEMLWTNRMPMRILEGQEIMASDDMIRKIKDGKLISLNKTQYYLVEFPFESDPNWMWIGWRTS